VIAHTLATGIDLLAAVEHQAALRARRDLAKALPTTVQADNDAFVGTHRVKDAQHKLLSGSTSSCSVPGSGGFRES
jgi:hypothetical protein